MLLPDKSTEEEGHVSLLVDRPAFKETRPACIVGMPACKEMQTLILCTS